jgi:hypothetical protein
MSLGDLVKGLSVNNVCLNDVLKPAEAYLDGCWWYIGGAGMQFPSVRTPKRAPVDSKSKKPPVPPFDAVDWERYLNESKAAREEYANWLVSDDIVKYRVGKPGFFSRYIAGIDGNWAMYCASDAPELRPTSFDEFESRFKRHWFDPPPENLPDDICLIARDVDAAYLDLFFRDEWLFQSVWSFLETKGMKPRPFQRLDFESPRRKRK